MKHGKGSESLAMAHHAHVSLTKPNRLGYCYGHGKGRKDSKKGRGAQSP